MAFVPPPNPPEAVETSLRPQHTENAQVLSLASSSVRVKVPWITRVAPLIPCKWNPVEWLEMFAVGVVLIDIVEPEYPPVSNAPEPRNRTNLIEGPLDDT